MAASGLLRDGASISSSSLLALARKSHFPDPPHFHRGLLNDFLHLAHELAFLQADAYLIATLDVSAAPEDEAIAGSLADRIATRQDAQGAECLDASGDFAEAAFRPLLRCAHCGAGALYGGDQGCPPFHQPLLWVRQCKALARRPNALAAPVDRALEWGVDLVPDVVQSLSIDVHQAGRLAQPSLKAWIIEARPGVSYSTRNGSVRLFIRVMQTLQQRLAAGGDDLRRGRRGCRAAVSYQIGDRDVDLVSDG